VRAPGLAAPVAEGGPRVGPPRRFLLAAFGDPGHAFPAIALGRALVARGHEVCLQTWRRWEDHVEAEGMRFAPAPEYLLFPGRRAPLQPYVAAVRGAIETRPLVAEFRPDAVVVDILTVAAGLAAELEGRPRATLIPHLLPTPNPGFPPYSTGARLPRTPGGRGLWRAFDPLIRSGVRRGRDELNGARGRVGLPPIDHLHGGISRELALVATFPQLEYPRRAWHPSIRVTGPLLWERPAPAPSLPPGDDPLVLVASSTTQDPDGRMLGAALEGLAGERVRVLAATAGRRPFGPGGVPANARTVDWFSYAATMPECAAVVTHAGHGTVAQALRAGTPIIACPAGGDMGETGARLAWAGVGVSLPRRLTTARGIRLAVRRVLAEEGYARRAAEFRRWMNRHPPGDAAARGLEQSVRRADAQ
jgi:UDP:flavonoid glycosyltransferase YjiC (YdhE family)